MYTIEATMLGSTKVFTLCEKEDEREGMGSDGEHTECVVNRASGCNRSRVVVPTRRGSAGYRVDCQSLGLGIGGRR